MEVIATAANCEPASAAGSFTIFNLDPTVRIIAPDGDIFEGTEAAFTFVIVDPGDDTFTLTVRWGDGSQNGWRRIARILGFD